MIGHEKFIREILIILFGFLISVAGAMLWVNGGYQKEEFPEKSSCYFSVLYGTLYCVHGKRKVFWRVVVLAFVLVMLFENLEMPFTQPLWLMLYLGLGRFFGAEALEGNTNQSTVSREV